MRFLIDEDVPGPIVDWLQIGGRDSILAKQLSPGQTDMHWLELAENDRRIVITADKDFGELVFRDKLNSHGIVLLRLFDPSPLERLLRLQEVWSVVEANPVGKFIVVTSKRVRVRSIL